MKHIHPYYTMTFNFEEFSIYKMYGSYPILIDKLKKMNYNNRFDNIIDHMIIEMKEDRYKNTYGLYLIYAYSFSYYPIEKNEEKMLDDYKKHFRYKGEIKFENNKIILDTLEVDIKNYNI